jgi:hypothetical protein
MQYVQMGLVLPANSMQNMETGLVPLAHAYRTTKLLPTNTSVTHIRKYIHIYTPAAHTYRTTKLLLTNSNVTYIHKYMHIRMYVFTPST